MALIGGAGNPVGGSFTGPAQALEVIGDHAYGYSGKFPATTSNQTVFEFTSGNYYLVGEFTFNGFVDDDNPSQVAAGACEVSFNSTGILLLTVPTTSAPHTVSNAIVIPPYTEVKATVDGASDEPDRYATFSIVGRIYRTRD